MAIRQIPLRHDIELVLDGPLALVSRQAGPQPFLQCSRTPVVTLDGRFPTLRPATASYSPCLYIALTGWAIISAEAGLPAMDRKITRIQRTLAKEGFPTIVYEDETEDTDAVIRVTAAVHLQLCQDGSYGVIRAEDDGTFTDYHCKTLKEAIEQLKNWLKAGC